MLHHEMRRSLLLFALAAVVAAIAVPAASAGTATFKSFKLPGNKVRCIMGANAPGNYVLCIAIQAPGARPFPRLNCRQEGDPGGGLSLSHTGRAKGICLSENPISPPVRLLRYGRSIQLGGIACVAVSKAVGVRCENANAHGFEMSPSAWKRF